MTLTLKHLPHRMLKSLSLLPIAVFVVLLTAVVPHSATAQSDAVLPLALADGTTAISGSVLDASTGQMLADAEIFINGERAGITNASGQFSLSIALKADYLMADIVVSRAGYGSWTMTQTALFPGVTRLLDPIALGAGPVTVEGGINPAEALYTEADLAARQQLQRSVPFDPEAYLPQGRDAVVSHFEVPLTIKVGITPHIHCHEWIRAGQPVTEVVEMDLKQYVKNVLPNEWISSWHPQSLMAGAMAAKTFAWYKIILPSYRPKGADVVDNTCDQVFIRNSRRDTTDAAVDATWHYRLSRNNRIFEIHYLAYDRQCANQPTWECMGQWDSRDKAEAGWTWQALLHHYYNPSVIDVTTSIPPNTNLARNGGFESDASQWLTWGGIEGAHVADGVYRFQRKAGSTNPATIYQDYNVRVPKDTPMMVKLKIGNNGPTPKTIRVHLHRPESWVGAQTCEFVIPPGLPMQKYAVYLQNPDGWVGLRLEIQGMTDDGVPAYLLDGIKLKYRTKGKPADVPACAAPMPKRPTVYNPAQDKSYGKHLIVTLFEGESNLRPGYSPAYHVQVSRTADFSSLVFDNGAAPSVEQNIRVTLHDGQFYLRARQFDGVDRYSKFTKPVSFRVAVLPGEPTPINPVGTVSAPTAFTWTDGGDTSTFKVVVKDTAGNKLGKVKLTPAEATCSTGTCTVTTAQVGAVFTSGQSYTWKLVAKNPNGKAKVITAFVVQ